MPQSFYFPTQGGMEYGRYSRGANPMDTSPRIPRPRATSTVLPLNGITGPTERELLQRLAITKSPDRHDIPKNHALQNDRGSADHLDYDTSLFFSSS